MKFTNVIAVLGYHSLANEILYYSLHLRIRGAIAVRTRVGSTVVLSYFVSKYCDYLLATPFLRCDWGISLHNIGER